MEVIDQNSKNPSQISKSYVQVTHYNCVSTGNPQPSNLGFLVQPFPSSLFNPKSSVFSDEKIFRCSSCGGFYNKFNQRLNDSFQCSLCGSTTKLIKYTDETSTEYTDEVYDVFTSTKYAVRTSFVPTDFFIISLSLLQHKPEIFDLIFKYCKSTYQMKQVGIAIFHGSLDVFKFRDVFTVQRFVDDIIIGRPSQYFIASPGFCEYLNLIKVNINSLTYSPQSISLESFSNFILQITSSFGSSLHLILDENDFHHMSHFQSFRSNAIQISKFGGQVSLLAFVNDLQYRNPLIDLPIITGGYLKILNSNISNNDFCGVFSSLLNRYLYHDAFIYVIAPDHLGISDYAGKGILKTSKSINVPKIEVGDTFYFTFDSSKVKHPYIQFIIFFTTQMNVNKFRIITFPFFYEVYNQQIMSAYVSAMIAQRLLIEGTNVALELLENYEKMFGKNSNETNTAKYLLSCNKLDKQLEIALTLRDGEKKYQRMLNVESKHNEA